MDGIEEKDVVDYLEVTALDSDGLIFRNLHGKFLAKNPFFTLNSKMVKMTW